MNRRLMLALAALGILLLFGPTVGLALANPDDDIPGVPITASPVMGYVASGSDMADVYSIAMKQNDRLHIVFNCGAPGGVWASLYAPDALSITTTDPLESGYASESYPQTFTYNVPHAGTYFVSVETSPYQSDNQGGNYSLAWTCKSPTLTRLSTHSKTIRIGTSTAIKGGLKTEADSAAISAATVHLQRLVAGHWKAMTIKATTDAKGRFAFRVRPKTTSKYRAVFTGTSKLLSSKSVAIRIKTT